MTVLDHDWRVAHAAAGDAQLNHATELALQGRTELANAWAAIAQAHYQAANIRTKPVSTDYEDRT